MNNKSIFDKTMADMTYQEIEEFIEKEAVVLFPIAVIEEHGPHLPLGTDTYLTYSMLRYIQEDLSKMNIDSIIAPPFYWGINKVTGGFVGSFTVKVDTMKAVLKDTIECLDRWGFKKVFFINLHGDSLHCKTILDVAKEIYESHMKIDAYDIIPEFFKNACGLDGKEPYILVQEDDGDFDDKQEYIDIHAGGFETSLMLIDFKELVDEDKARKLKSSKTTFQDLRKWQQGGESAKEVTPLGYCGNPSNINLKDATGFIKGFSDITARLIKNTL
ncbi:creatininase family protein [Vallitalea guaymasensis]|uniref:creatininase family protein n=1 Tax=Vallitalea guaymasensis TaxID=1185412 RepID=UPI0023557B13|nr:creatininase family protein [Vallitalea guaymasensis]